MRLARQFTAIAVIVATFASLTAAQEWTRFRGPNGAGQSDAKTIPAQWSERDYNWKVSLPGIGHSSPVLWGDKIFLTSAEPESGNRIAMCLSAKNGELLWKREYPLGTHVIHTQNSFASSTPAVDADHVYFAWGTPKEFALLALDHSGEQVWRVDVGPHIARHGFATSPMLYQDMVIITNDQEGTSTLLAVDRKNGQIRWNVPRKTRSDQNASYAVPCVYQRADGSEELIVHSWAHGVSGVDPKTGATNWETAVFPLRPVGSPIIVGGLILGNCGEGSGNNTVVALQPGGKDREPEVVYKIDRTSAPYVPTLLAYGDLVFLWGDRGVVTCIDGPTGKIHWRERVGGNYSGSPLRVADRIYCISQDGEVVVLAASDQYKLISRNPLGESSRSTPAVADGVMYLRTESQLFSLGGKN